MEFPSTKTSALAVPQPFTRLEATSVPASRSRTSSLQNRVQPLSMADPLARPSSADANSMQNGDIFEKSSLISGEEGSVNDIEEVVDSPSDIPEGFDKLPIELVSLIDRFIDSLSAKVYNTPPTIDKLSSIFQEFYTKAASHIATHISALSTQQARGSSPHASISSKSSQSRPPPRSSSRDTLNSTTSSVPEQQMLTPQEVSNRRRARRLLDKKGLALEEAVERRVCERVYNRIWRHRSTLDEVRDEKLRSRTAALAVVGIGLKDLGIAIASGESKDGETNTVEESVSRARAGLLRMNYARHPLGKLEQLAAAHKSIVDMLTDFHNSSSSADEILPTLIYTLITTPPEGINVISNLHFIQRFRTSSKIDGEAAYCLTNLEAAVTFLETVDLASLRSDETPQGSSAESSGRRPVTPQKGSINSPVPKEPSPATISAPVVIESTPTADEKRTEEQSLQTSAQNMPSPQSDHRRRVSDIFQPPAAALGAAGDAVFNSADQSIKGIGSALDNSFKLLFGRLGEQKAAVPNADAAGTIIVPKTLDDARKLVEPKAADDEGHFSDTNPLAERPEEQGKATAKADDSLLDAVAGGEPSQRERSVDSNQSVKAQMQNQTPAGNAAIESMRNFGNSINPLKGLGGMNVMRGFGRNSSSGTLTVATMGATNAEISANATRRSSSPADVAPAGIKTLPPVQRFIEASDANSLKLSDVPELLEDYKRLAMALKTLGAF